MITIEIVLAGAGICFIAGQLPATRIGRRPLWLGLTLLGLIFLQATHNLSLLTLPLLTLLLVGGTWRITQDETPIFPDLPKTHLALIGIILLALLMLAPAFGILISLALLTLLAGSGLLSLIDRRRAALVWICVIVALLVLFKLRSAQNLIIGALEGIDSSLVVTDITVRYFSSGENAGISGAGSALIWVGLAYISLRLIHILLDFRPGRLNKLSLSDALIYVLFPPTLLAGPIDRAERFIPELHQGKRTDAEGVFGGGRRLMVGMFKKFVLADQLALIALSPDNAADVVGIGGAWLLAYAYALYIFLDFSGYSDMAIGLGRLAGFNLPENFNQPYLRQNLRLFWQNWHMTLTSWFRAYVFMPLSRYLLRRQFPVSDFLLAQVVTMSLIAFWHGLTINFFLWGLWHAAGLYGHKLISDKTRPWYLRARKRTLPRRLIYLGGMLTTFHYVLIGWVFFALDDLSATLAYLRMMFGL